MGGEDAADGSALAGIVVGRACAVGVDVLDVLRLKPGHLQGFAHGEEGSLAAGGRGRLVEGIATVGVAADIK